MVWLRYELWEDHNGSGYRLGDKAETDRLQVASPEAKLSNIFYAPSPAAAEAQYCALRGIGPYIVNPADSEEPFTMAQLERQLADFPHDERLARQPALPQVDGAHVAVAAHEPDHAKDGHHPEAAAHPVAHVAEHHDHADTHASDHVDSHGDHAEDAHAHDHAPVEVQAAHHEPDPHDSHETSHGEPVESHAHPTADHAHDDHAAPVAATHQAPHDLHPAHASVEPTVSEPATSSAEMSALGPITLVAAASNPAIKRRKPNAVLGFLRLVIRLVMLVIVLGAVTVGVGIATGNLDAATVLAKARALPMQIRELHVVRSLLP